MTLAKQGADVAKYVAGVLVQFKKKRPLAHLECSSESL